KGDWDAQWIPPAPSSASIRVPQEISPRAKTHPPSGEPTLPPKLLRLTVMDEAQIPLPDVSFLLNGINGASNPSGEISIPIVRLSPKGAAPMFHIYLNKPGFVSADYYVGLHDNDPLILKTK